MTGDTITVHRDLPFHDTEERQLSLDVYEPAERGPNPAILFVHGGGFVVGDKGQFARYALRSAAEGYVTVESQYRLGPEASFPAALIDVKAAIEWLRTEGPAFGVDPNRIAIVGHSAGGGLATLAATTADDPGLEPERYPGTSSAVDAAVGYAGVYDLSTWGDPAEMQEYLGADPERRREAELLASPIEQADATTPPTLLAHGVEDEIVPLAQSERFYEVLDAVTTAELELFEGEGADHGFLFHPEHYDRTFERTLSFLDRHV